MDGEAEWLAMASKHYGWAAPDIWIENILPHLTQGRLTLTDYEDLRLFCPRMLEALSRQRIDQTRSATLTRILAALWDE